ILDWPARHGAQAVRDSAAPEPHPSVVEWAAFGPAGDKRAGQNSMNAQSTFEAALDQPGTWTIAALVDPAPPTDAYAANIAIGQRFEVVKTEEYAPQLLQQIKDPSFSKYTLTLAEEELRLAGGVTDDQRPLDGRPPYIQITKGTNPAKTTSGIENL